MQAAVHQLYWRTLAARWLPIEALLAVRGNHGHFIPYSYIGFPLGGPVTASGAVVQPTKGDGGTPADATSAAVSGSSGGITNVQNVMHAGRDGYCDFLSYG